MAIEILPILESYFAFGGVHVDIDKSRRDFEEEKADRMPASHQQAAISLQQRMLQAAVLNPASIQEQVLIFSCGTIQGWFANITPQPDGPHFRKLCRRFHTDQFVADLGVVEASDSLQRISGCGKFVDEAVIVAECECKCRIGQGNSGELFHDTTEFCRRFLQKSASRRRVEEKIADFHDCARRTAAVCVCDDVAAVTFQFPSLVAVFGAGADSEPGYGSNRCQSLAAKTQCRNMVQIGVGSNLAGRMAGDSEKHVFVVDSLAIVRNSDQFHTAVDDLDVDSG